VTTSQTVKKHPQKTYTCSKPRQNCFGNWIEHCLHYSNSSRQWRHARHHWEILDEEGTLLKSNLSESDISPERLYQYHSRSRFSKADSKRRSKTYVFFIDPQKTKVDQNCYTDLLKTSLQSECRRLYPGNDFECLQDSVLSHHAKVTSARGYKVIGQILNICINYAN